MPSGDSKPQPIARRDGGGREEVCARARARARVQVRVRATDRSRMHECKRAWSLRTTLALYTRGMVLRAGHGIPADRRHRTALQVSAGDLSMRTLALCAGLVKLLVAHRLWLNGRSNLVAVVVCASRRTPHAALCGTGLGTL